MDETPARQCANGSATSQDGVDGARLEPYALSGSGLAGAVGCVVAALLPPFMTGALAVQVSADLRFGETALGIAVSVFFVTAAVTSVPLGRAAEKHGPARALRWAGGTSALCLLGIAGAARTYGVLVGLLAIGGAAVAAAQPAANKATS